MAEAVTQEQQELTLPSDREKVQCRLGNCTKRYHRLDVHIQTAHGMTVEEYLDACPGAPIRSAYSEAAAEETAVQGGSSPAVGKGEFVFGVARLAVRRGVEPGDEALIPEHDENWEPGTAEKSALEDLALAMEHDENALLVGPTGCGKSLLVQQLACALEQPLRRVNLHGEVRAADFLGEKIIDVEPASGQAVVKWQDGVLPQAMRRGHWLLLDELDAASAAVLFVLQGVLETGRRLTLMPNAGEVVQAHPQFRIVATANTLGRGDESGLYTGTRVLNEAFLDRFGTVIESRYPNEETECKILVKRSGLEQDVALVLVKAARHVREAFAKDEVSCTFSTRRLVAWAQKTKVYGNARRAAGVAVLHKLGRDDRGVVEGVIQRYVGEG